MSTELFSRRFGFEKPKKLREDDLPENVRNRIAHIFRNVREQYSDDETWVDLSDYIFFSFGERTCRSQFKWNNYHSSYFLRGFWEKRIEKEIWYKVLDIFVKLFEYFIKKAVKEKSRSQLEYANHSILMTINDIFKEELFPWIMVNGQFERVIEQIEVIKKAKVILEMDEFIPIREHYTKAWEAFNKRPKPDIDGCMDNAWDALEAQFKHFAGKKAKTYGEAIDLLEKNGMILKEWKPLMDKFNVPAQQWARHKKNVIPNCTLRDAELFLIIASQLMIYLDMGAKSKT